MNLTRIRMEILYRGLSELFNRVVCAGNNGSTPWFYFLVIPFYSALKLIFWSKMVKKSNPLSWWYISKILTYWYLIEYDVLAMVIILCRHWITFIIMMKSATWFCILKAEKIILTCFDSSDFFWLRSYHSRIEIFWAK